MSCSSNPHFAKATGQRGGVIHRITTSANARTVDEISTPIARAALRLTTSRRRGDAPQGEAQHARGLCLPGALSRRTTPIQEPHLCNTAVLCLRRATGSPQVRKNRWLFDNNSLIETADRGPRRATPQGCRPSGYGVAPRSRRGGYRPVRRKAVRSTKRSIAFNCSNTTVVRPSAVTPMMCSPVSRKCSAHRCARGLKRGTSAPVAGSRELISLPFRRLHTVHDKARFSSTVWPPCFSAIT
jgi:hypothetical protein